MNFLAEPPSVKRPKRRVGQPAIWKTDSSRRTVQVSVLATLLVHLLLFVAVPRVFKPDPRAGLLDRVPQEKTFNVDLAPEEAPVPTPPPKPFKFVEINPDAPDNPPDQTENFGAQNQQVAQEKPSENDDKSEAPKSEDKKVTDSTAIVTGRLAQPEPIQLPSPPSPQTPEEERAEQAAAEALAQEAAKQARSPLPGFEKIDGEAQDSIGSNIAKLPPPNAKRAEDSSEGDSPEVREVVTATGQVVRIDPRRPMQRERIPEKQVRPAFLANNPVGTKNIGPVAYNAKWSEYGAYLQRLIETVQIQWERLLRETGATPSPGTVVAVTFRLNDKGAVTDITADDSPGPQHPKRLCVSAITARSPYGEWSDEMIAVLGHEQEMTFTFYYN